MLLPDRTRTDFFHVFSSRNDSTSTISMNLVLASAGEISRVVLSLMFVLISLTMVAVVFGMVDYDTQSTGIISTRLVE